MNIIFAGSKGKTGSIIYSYLKEKGYNITKEINIDTEPLEKVISPGDTIIDFTNKDTAYKHANICLENNAHFICGTTGIEEKSILELNKKAQVKNLHFIFNPNFSLCIRKILPLLESLKNDFNASIKESHHISKLDIPSGTALLLKKHLRESTPIESIRTTYQSLTHTITMHNDYEEITITHNVKDKLAYALGVEKELQELIAKATISQEFPK